VKLRVCIIGLTLCLVPSAAVAQSVSAQDEAARRAGDPYFHEAAQYYVDRQKRQAIQVIEEGLQQSPQHPKLLSLLKKIRDASSAQPQSDDDSPDEAGRQPQTGNASSSPQESPKPGDASPENNPSSGEQRQNDPGGQDGRQEEAGEDPQQPGDQGPLQGGTPGDPRPEQGEGSQGEREGQMSRAQAERILQALEGQEKQLLREVQKREARPQRVEKDW